MDRELEWKENRGRKAGAPNNKLRRPKTSGPAGMARALLACLLVFAAVFLYPWKEARGAVQNEAYESAGVPVALEASYGFDNMAKGGRYLPVYVTLSSQSEEVFEGSLRVVSMESDYNIYQYEFPVTLEAGETRQQNLNIPLGVKADQLYVCLYDSHDQMVMRKRLKLNTSEDIPELLIGVISDTQDQLQYLDDVGVSYSTLRTRVCAMIAGSVPTQAAGLDQLDVLLISNYDIRRLSEDQIATIREWVNRGGVLVLGTGGRGVDSLFEFLEDNLENEPEDLGEIIVDMGEGYISQETGNSGVVLECNDITLKEGTVLMESEGIPLLTAVPMESGIIAAAAFDFADLAPFCTANPSVVDKILTLLLGDSRINGLSDYLYSGTSKTYWAVQGIINAGSMDKLPHIGLYAVVLVSYILLVGPGLYFFLKHRELRAYYRSGVVALSLLCTGIIYVISGKTRFTDTFFNYASILDVSEEVITESTYVNMQAPYNRPYSVKLDPAYSIRPVTRNAYYDAEQIPKFNGEEEPNVAIRYGKDATTLKIQDMAAFSSNYFKLEKRFDNETGVGITAEIEYFEGDMNGLITNNMDCRLEDAAILLYGTMAYVGDLEPGETKSLDDLPLFNFPVDASVAWETAEQITGKWEYEKADITDPDYMKAMARTSLLDFFLDSYLTGYQPGARIVAFRGGEEDVSFLQETGYDVSGITMYTASADVEMERDGMVYRPVMMKSPKVVNGTYQASSNTISGMTPVTLEYSLGSDLYIEGLTFETLSPIFMESGLYNNLRQFEGSIYFYNYSEGDYDQMDSSQTRYEDWQLEPYLSPGNTITIKYVCAGTDEFGDVALPILSVTGRRP